MQRPQRVFAILRRAISRASLLPQSLALHSTVVAMDLNLFADLSRSYHGCCDLAALPCWNSATGKVTTSLGLPTDLALVGAWRFVATSPVASAWPKFVEAGNPQ